MYGATKAFVSQLASCLHVELYNEGIDVCAIHPSPVKSNFYNDLDHKVELLDAAAKQAVAPDSKLADDFFRSIGVCALRDLGGALFVSTKQQNCWAFSETYQRKEWNAARCVRLVVLNQVLLSFLLFCF